MIQFYKIMVKPVSQNKANGITKKGKIYKTKEYTAYKEELGFRLPKDIAIPPGPLKLKIIAGLSRDDADADNPVKPFQDILASHYDFNDRRIYDVQSRKRLVDKGSEYIAFALLPLTEKEISVIDERSKPRRFGFG